MLLTSIVLGAVVLQTYITASFIIEACARARLSICEDGWKLATGYTLKIRVRYELSLLTKIFLGKAGTLFSLSPRWHPCTVFCGRCVLSSQTPFRIKFPYWRCTWDGGYKILHFAIFMAITEVPLSYFIIDQQWIQVACVRRHV
jgi:hypothetical protein